MGSFTMEYELFKPVVTYFEQRHCLVASEVRIGFCRADLVAFHPDHIVSAVELKLADWKKAIVQARNYQLGADYVYLAFPEKKCSLVLKRAENTLRKQGIGLLAVDEQTQSIDVLISSRISSNKFGTITTDEVWAQKVEYDSRRRIKNRK